MLAQMSPRERTLVFVIGGAVLIFVNVMLLKFFIKNHSQLRVTMARAQQDIDDLKRRDSERAMWAQRDAWITQNLPVIGDSMVAGRELGITIKEVAQRHGVTIESPNPGVPAKLQGYTSLPYKISVKASWRPMFQFLQELQAPGKFIVLDPMDLKVDASDKTQLRADVTVSKWFAP